MDANEVAEAQRRSMFKRRRLVQDYEAVFTSLAGRRVLADIFRKCMLDQVGVMQKETAIHQQGRRFVFALIYKMLHVTEEEFLRLTEESDP